MKKVSFSLLAMLALFSCSRDRLLKDVNLLVRTDLLVNPITIQVVDANPLNAAPDASTIDLEIVGPNRDQVFSVIGKKKPAMDGRFINLAIRKKNGPSMEKPVVFGLIARAPGYLPAVKFFNIVDTAGFRLELLPMIKKSAPPSGVTIVETTFQVNGAQGTSQPLTVATTPQNGDDEQISIEIGAGTQFFEAGSTTPLSGTAVMTVTHFSGINSKSEWIPGGPNTGQILESNGRQKKPGTTALAAPSSIDVFVGGKKVSGFSAPLVGTATVSPDFVNPTTGQPLAAGDSIPVWSYDDETGIWNDEPKDILESMPGGQLGLTFQIPHLSAWAPGWFPGQACQFQGVPILFGQPPAPIVPSPIWKVTSTIEPTEICGYGGGYFWTELTSLNGRHTFYGSWENWWNGREIDLGHWLTGGPAGQIRLKIWAGTPCSKGNVLWEAVLDPCQNQTLHIGNALPKGLEVNISVSGECTGDIIVIPTAPIFYRESGTGDDCYRLLGYIRLGTGCSGNLEKGATYDFAVFYGTMRKLADGVTIPAEDADIVVKDPVLMVNETVQIRYTGDNKEVLNFYYLNIRIPDALCAEYRKFF